MTTTQNPTPTALMPLDPAVSPQHALRILPIRANLLPDEITAGRNARRARAILILAVLLTIAGLGGWYLYAVNERTVVEDDLAAVTAQVDRTRNDTKADKYTSVTRAIEQSDTITAQLKIAMNDDLPWSTLYDSLRKSKVKGITITNINGFLDTDITKGAAAPAAGATRKLGNMTIMGEAKDKKTIATYLDKIATVKGMANVYLSNATKDDGGEWIFSINAQISGDRLCGRFTDPCKTGGK
ncbi:hypothetical protein [Paractinoplanes rishiriensis]|uniref:Fimbrial assembly family protein n=1 Tax=Paractinoplanes rishiriensis TaxID=1050105 RepID=A0A919JVV1_9ACTN|nr:hypothetical protein [Actinoplanes rishiriensis]GIE95788.1 hypothetical protein Ari01nite_32530 [Actinoplanes rishiriensis]